MKTTSTLAVLSTLVATSHSGWCSTTTSSTPSLPTIKTQLGCEDALDPSRYDKKNLGQTLGKIKNKHLDSHAQYGSKDTWFYSNTIGNTDALLTYIQNNCQFKKVTAGTQSNSAACYFKCSNNIGFSYNESNKKVDSKKILLSYTLHNTKKDSYYLLSIYPAKS